MEILKFSTLEKSNTKSKYVYPYNRNDGNIKPTHILRHNEQKFELREIAEKSALILCELDVQDIINLDKNINDVQLQYAQYFYLNEKLLILIATKTTDGLETFLYMLDPLDCRSSLSRIHFSRKLKGQISNIFVSKNLKNSDKDDYYIMTIGTMDSALYVIRFTAFDILKDDVPDKAAETDEKKPPTQKVLTCGLARTDARNAITQEIIVLNNQSKTPTNVYIVCAGFNGIMDFFLLKGDADIHDEIILEYQRHDLLELPSNLPIVSLQCLESNSDQQEILLAVGQELFKPLKISRAIEPSMTVLKLNMKDLACKKIATSKFGYGTHISLLSKISNDPEKFKLCTYIIEDDKLNINQTHFDASTFQFNDKINNLLDKPTITELQDFCIVHERLIWLLDKQGHHIVHPPIRKSHKRQLSNSDTIEHSQKR